MASFLRKCVWEHHWDPVRHAFKTPALGKVALLITGGILALILVADARAFTFPAWEVARAVPVRSSDRLEIENQLSEFVVNWTRHRTIPQGQDGVVELEAVGPINPLGDVHFLRSEVIAESGGKRLLGISGDDLTLVWWNGELIGRSDGGPFQKYQLLLNVELNPGRNDLVVAVVNLVDRAFFAAGFVSDEDWLLHFVRLQGHGMFESDHVSPGTDLAWRVPFAPSVVGAGEVEVYHLSEHQSVDRLHYHLPEAVRIDRRGVARVVFSYNGRKFEDYIWIGTLDELCQQVVRVTQHAPDRVEDSVRPCPYWYRLRHLIKPDNVQRSDSHWRQKVLFALWHYGLAQLNRQKVGAEFGLKLEQVDSSPDSRYLRVYVPSSAAAGPVPLKIVLPAPMEHKRPFLENATIADHRLAVKYAALAEYLGVAVLWPDCGESLNETPQYRELADVALQAMIKRGDIDLERIGLIGICGSAFDALAWMADSRRFSSVALGHPIVEKATAEWYRSRGGWISGNTPLFFTHDPREKSAPYWSSRAFAQILSNSGLDVSFLESSIRTVFEGGDEFEKLLRFGLEREVAVFGK